VRWSRASKRDNPPDTGAGPSSRLAFKYAALMISVMGAVLVANGLVTMWLSFDDQKSKLSENQKLQAQLAATKISQFVREVEAQLQWLLIAPWASPSLEERRIDGLRILRNTPAITEIVLVGADGREELKLARLASDQIGSGADWSGEPAVTAAAPDRPYHGPVYYQRSSEPYMRIAMVGSRKSAGVVVADVNLKLIWDVIAQIRFGKRGMAYVVDAAGRLIAHPDISLVLKNTDTMRLDQVRLALGASSNETWGLTQPIYDLNGQRVMAASARIPGLDWVVFAELPVQEALAPARQFLNSTLIALIAGLGSALLAGLVLARKLTKPIRELQTGAALIGTGALEHRLTIRSSDELGALGADFNRMAEQLQSSYASLERKVDERTAELDAANKAKQRFLAIASHDLRQPLHAMTLFLSQLRSETDMAKRDRVLERLDAATSNLNTLFDDLLDISRLDAGLVRPCREPVSVGALLATIETTFARSAEAKGLVLAVSPTSAWVESDPVLLGRIMQNLVSNAIRYTTAGSVHIVAKNEGVMLKLDVIDTGVGIDPSQHERIFGEYFRATQSAGRDIGGLGLGLFIVERLTRLLQHTIEVTSKVGHGSTFSLWLPLSAAPRSTQTATDALLTQATEFAAGRRALVIDDDPLALDAMASQLEAWGFDVDQAQNSSEAHALARARSIAWDLIVADFDLGSAEDGARAVLALRSAAGRDTLALLVSADTSGRAETAAKIAGLTLLRKPVLPVTLRAVTSRLIAQHAAASSPAPEPH
jgi:signal transduction histidine kinase/ActR/RegA family two-component response regulator